MRQAIRYADLVLACALILGAVGIGVGFSQRGAAARDGAQSIPQERVLTATTLVRLSDDSEERSPVSFTLRVPAVCVEAFHAGPEKGVVILKPVAGNQACVFAPDQADLIDATRGQSITVLGSRADFAERRRADHLNFYTVLTGTEFGLERRERPHHPLNKNPEINSPIVFLERERTSSLVDIWCYPKSQDHWLCPFHMHPRPNLAIEARIKFKGRHRWPAILNVTPIPGLLGVVV